MPRIEQRTQRPGSEHWLWPDGTHPVLRQVFSRREIESPGELDLALGRLRPVGEFASLDRGVDLLCRHRDGRVVVVGDFDADGATSCAVAVLGLRGLGAPPPGRRGLVRARRESLMRSVASSR